MDTILQPNLSVRFLNNCNINPRCQNWATQPLGLLSHCQLVHSNLSISMLSLELVLCGHLSYQWVISVYQRLDSRCFKRLHKHYWLQ